MPCTLATVHMQDLAGDEAGILQIEDRVDDGVNLAETTDRPDAVSPGCRRTRSILNGRSTASWCSERIPPAIS